MPSSSSVREQLTDVVVQVLGCDPADVVPEATFAELGSDSLTIVEIGDELGRRFDVYLSDDTIDGLRTVQDAITAVVEHEPATGPAFAAPVAADAAPVVDEVPLPADAEKRAWSAARWLTVTGILVGGLIGLAMSAVIAATGISAVTLPPLPSTSESATPTPTPTPTTPKKTTPPATPEPTIEVSSPQVAPGQRFVLSGSFPELGANVLLDIEFREGGGSWERFPVDARTRDQGEFKVELYTSRTGAREFRLRNPDTNQTTPNVDVRIG